MRGLTFEINNEYGKCLEEILSGIIEPSWFWSIGPGEAYKCFNNSKLELFPPNNEIMDTKSFMNIITTGKYYLIFSDIKAFPTRESIVEIKTYDDFLKSSCQLALLVIDSVFVSIFVKSEEILCIVYECAKKLAYTNIKFITEDESEHNQLTVWG
ncbi:DUF2691 family protein [Caryophanon tenue]|uniref:DUF2691 domain-containing protein n=1 Tax=Caryophanon tenue TaxID=33978 RepID=A0A1C0YEG9_9BACL|nr:DUF2691 family protein [Caryophanon tenue]OCS85535.1 hypothetical protein A6M13_13060 [Caryophanon tenue]